MGKLTADLYLAYRAVFVHPLRRLRRTGPRGKAGFLAAYGSEGLAPTTTEDKVMLAAAGRCIACGLCDAIDGQLGVISRGVYDGTSLVPLQYARSSVELLHARDAIDAIDPERYRAAEAICPTRVPLVALASWLKDRLARTRALTAQDEASRGAPR